MKYWYACRVVIPNRLRCSCQCLFSLETTIPIDSHCTYYETDKSSSKFNTRHLDAANGGRRLRAFASFIAAFCLLNASIICTA